MTNGFLALLAGVFGLVFGSFINVVALRDDRRGSILSDRSRCPHCGHVLAWYDLVPLFSYLSTGGRCRYCRKPVSWRYPAIEVLTAGLFALLWYSVGTPEGPYYAQIGLSAAGLLLVAVSLIDIQTFEVPVEYVVAAGLVGTAGQLLGAGLTPVQSALGLVLGAGILLAIMGGWKLAFKQDGMGEGDAWIAGAIGAMVGPGPVLVALMAAVFAGSAFGITAIGVGKKQLASRIPFGPFLAVGWLVAVVWGQRIVDWYILGL